jgi:hypothetical protein
MTKAYFDTVIVSGLVLGDLRPPHEMYAARRLKAASEQGIIEAATSRLTADEQSRTSNLGARERLQETWPTLAVIEDDTRLAAGGTAIFHDGGVSVAPSLTGVLDQVFFDDLRALGVGSRDAQHLTYAVVHAFDVTLDTRDILPKRTEIEARCRGLRVIKPSELIRILDEEWASRPPRHDGIIARGFLGLHRILLCAGRTVCRAFDAAI